MENTAKQKSKRFAVRIVKLYKYLSGENMSMYYPSSF